MPPTYRKLTWLLSAEREEELAARLWEEGTLGLQVHEAADGRIRLEAWFPAGAGQPAVPVEEGADAAGDGAPRLLAVEEVAGEDWLAAYRRQAAPFAVGERFWVDPREPGDAPPVAPAGRWPLRLPARSAFGTGSHESTRLAVELLGEAPPAGLAVLDVGTGTGILAFAALLLGARRAVGFDVDPAAALVARQNLDLNRPILAGCGPAAFFAGEAAALAAPDAGAGALFDLALVNIVPEKAAAALLAVGARLASGGGLILSGLLETQAPESLARLAALGLEPGAERRAGEWIAFRLAKVGEGSR